MTDTTFDVKIWATEKYQGSKVTTHRVIWKVAGKRWKRGHRTAAAAESFRSDLITASRKGEAFDIATGLPLSLVREQTVALSWYEFACQYIDAKWPATSPNHRMGTANVLMSVTVALLADRMPPDENAARAIRSALLNWGFNIRRGSGEQPAEVTDRLDWVARNSHPLTALADLA